MKKNRVMLLLVVLIFSLGVLASCLALFFMSSGCGTDSGFVTGERTMISNGVERKYYLKLPQNYNSYTLYPLIFGFHGMTGDHTSFTEGSYSKLSLFNN